MLRILWLPFVDIGPTCRAGIRTFHCNRLEEGSGAAPDREFWRSIMVRLTLYYSLISAA